MARWFDRYYGPDLFVGRPADAQRTFETKLGLPAGQTMRMTTHGDAFDVAHLQVNEDSSLSASCIQLMGIRPQAPGEPFSDLGRDLRNMLLAYISAQRLDRPIVTHVHCLSTPTEDDIHTIVDMLRSRGVPHVTRMKNVYIGLVEDEGRFRYDPSADAGTYLEFAPSVQTDFPGFVLPPILSDRPETATLEPGTLVRPVARTQIVRSAAAVIDRYRWMLDFPEEGDVEYVEGEGQRSTDLSADQRSQRGVGADRTDPPRQPGRPDAGAVRGGPVGDPARCLRPGRQAGRSRPPRNPVARHRTRPDRCATSRTQPLRPARGGLRVGGPAGGLPRNRTGKDNLMDFALTDDQLDLQKSFGSLFAAHAGSAVVRESEPLGFDAELWRRIGELGVPQLASAVASNGDPATLSQLIMIAGEYGRRLAPVPLLETLVTARLLDRFDQPPPTAGICTLALRPVTVDGAMTLLAGGAIADAVVALRGDELVLAGLSGAPDLVLNLGASPLANRTLAESPTVLARDADARHHHQRALDDWKVLLAAALVGAATEAHTMTVAYVKQRKAFNVPIGWFQTVAHRLADAINDLDGAYLLVHKAAWAIDSGSADAPKLASMAYSYTTELAERVTAECLHMHGGVGYTMEHDVQLYFRRAKAWPLALGDPRDEFLQVARRLEPAESSAAGA